METKVGQWVRKGEHIGEITTVHIGGYYIKCKTLRTPFNYVDSLYYKEWKVANTPQELIEVGTDLIVKRGRTYPQKVSVYCKNNRGVPTYVAGLGDYIEENEITKILTPNSNGGYDLQWVGIKCT